MAGEFVEVQLRVKLVVAFTRWKLVTLGAPVMKAGMCIATTALSTNKAYFTVLNRSQLYLSQLTVVAITIYPNTDINVPSSCNRQAAGVDSLLRSPQVVLRIRTISLNNIEPHTSSIATTGAILLGGDSSRVCVVIQSNESSI